MTQAKGTVTALDGDYALVKTEGEGGCGRCHEEGGCQGANVGRMFCQETRPWRVLNPRGAKVGDQVDVVVADGALKASAMLVYVLPLCLFLGGAVLGMAGLGEIGAIGGAASGLVLAWWIIRRVQKQRQDDPDFQPYIG